MRSAATSAARLGFDWLSLTMISTPQALPLISSPSLKRSAMPPRMKSSASANGLPYRWIPKSFISLGLILLLIAVLSVLMRVLVYLYGPPPLRDRAASVGVLSH